MSKEQIHRPELVGSLALIVRLAANGNALFAVELGPEPGTVVLATYDPVRRGRLVVSGTYTPEQLDGLVQAIQRVCKVARTDRAEAAELHGEVA